MNVRLPEHSHCIACDDPVPFDEKYCSDQCQEEHDATEKRTKRRNLLFYIGAIIAIVAVWLYSYIL